MGDEPSRDGEFKIGKGSAGWVRVYAVTLTNNLLRMSTTRDVRNMDENFKTLLEETNVISLRTAQVYDDGKLVCFWLMPAWMESSIPGSHNAAQKTDWLELDRAYVYRHGQPLAPGVELVKNSPWTFMLPERRVRPLKFEQPPELKFLWADSGNSVALFLNDEPWAFIDEGTQKGYSKGILDSSRTMGLEWDQTLFEKLFGDEN